MSSSIKSILISERLKCGKLRVLKLLNYGSYSLILGIKHSLIIFIIFSVCPPLSYFIYSCQSLGVPVGHKASPLTFYVLLLVPECACGFIRKDIFY